MGTLLRYELKKILSRRTAWVAVMIGLAALAASHAGFIRDRLSGYVRGMRYFYARYEGQVMTDALYRQMNDDYDGYERSHPEDYARKDWGGGSVQTEIKNRYGYSAGVEQAYRHIVMKYNPDKTRRERQLIEAALETGRNALGFPLAWWERDELSAKLERIRRPFTAVYAEGLDLLAQMGPLGGFLTICLIPFLVSPAYAGEGPCRMEAVLLAGTRRNALAGAKMLASILCGTALFALFWGVALLVAALTYELDGARAPAILSFDLTGGTMGGAVCALTALSLAAALAVSALSAWMSAIVTRPLTGLLDGVAATLLQFLAYSALGYIPFSYGDIPPTMLQICAELTPALAPLRAYDMIRLAGRAGALAAGLPISGSLFGLAVRLGPRCWLRRRKT